MTKKINMDKFKLNCVNSDMNVYHYKTVEDILAFLEKTLCGYLVLFVEKVVSLDIFLWM
jgi:hypothetical protein